jgi:hypothetical protein
MEARVIAVLEEQVAALEKENALLSESEMQYVKRNCPK